jgi:hypothetical protein
VYVPLPVTVYIMMTKDHEILQVTIVPLEEFVILVFVNEISLLQDFNL